MEDSTQRPHVAIVPTPGMGHLIPLTEFAKKLSLHHGFSVTMFIPTDGSPPKTQKSFLELLPEPVNIVYLPPLSSEDIPNNVKSVTRIALSVTRSLPALRNSVKKLAESTHLVALVVDLHGPDVFDVAQEFGIPKYIFMPCNAMAISLAFYLPELDRSFTGEYRYLPEPVKIPGSVSVCGSDLPDMFQDREHVSYRGMLHSFGKYKLADGIMVNSFLDLEPNTFATLMKNDGSGYSGIPPIYPVGPVVRIDTDNSGDECLKWLDGHPPGSVLFVSFGSGGTLSLEQLTELALGLELSGQRFIWVVRNPNEKVADAAFFGEEITENDPFGFLPKGFLERTKGVGLLLKSWAPQAQILSHKSTGGFLSHCGWNSTLESIVYGVPIIAWPLYAEQKINAVLLTDALKVSIRARADGRGVVGKEEVAKCVRHIFEGEEGKLIGKRGKDLKEAAAMAISEDGSSTKSLAQVAQIWKTL